jgi:hypothetical protein
MRRGIRSSWQWALLVGFGVGGLVVLAMLWNKAPTFYWHAKDPDAAVATTRAGILAAMAGFVAFTGIMINIAETRRTNELARKRDTQARERDHEMLAETRRAHEQARERDRLTHEREREAQLTERYTRAVDQLGSDTVDIRLGGIYALERIAKDSPDGHPTIVEVLSAFIREHIIPGQPGTRRRVDPSAQTDGPAARLDTDIHAALTILGRLFTRNGLFRADLTGIMIINADLCRAKLTGADLSGANLSDTQLFDANLTDTVLNGVNLTRAILNIANLTGADLGGANLSGAELFDANLSGADLGGANLTDAYLNGANLSGAELFDANLSGVRGLTQEQVDSAEGDGRTKLPPGLTRPASWSDA